MEFRILGPLEVVEEGHPLPLGGAKQRTLLAFLLLHANEVVSRERLIDCLWGEAPPETALTALQGYVSQLRKLLGRERLVTRSPGYLLTVVPEELDLGRLERLAANAREPEPKEAAAALAEALSLFHGPPLADFAYESWAQTEIGRLEELRLVCLEQRIEADLSLGRHAELVGELEALVNTHPLRERLRGQLMLALYRSRRQAEALAAFQETRTALVEELGIEPSPELQALERAILNQEPALDLPARPTDAALWPPGATERLGAVFVGRDRELSELLAGLEDALAGRGRLYLLAGEPGIGKSRLAEELAKRARERGARVLVGRCWEAGGAPAYWPWVQSLRAYVRSGDPQMLRAQLGRGAPDVAQLLPELRELFPDVQERTPRESEAARFRLFDATASFLRNVAEAQPLVLVLDDLHVADVPSVLLLRFVAAELEESRILVVGAYRDVDLPPDHPVAAALADLARQAAARFQLKGLAEADVSTFIELSTGLTPPPSAVATIRRETEGNPLFVGEVVRLLASEGRLERTEDPLAWHIPVPQGVRDAIHRRVDRLSPETRSLLTLASVLGREFAVDAIARLAEQPPDVSLAVLDEAMASRLVGEAPGGIGVLRFSHGLVRDAIYDGLTAARRTRLHRRAAEVLEEMYAHDPEPHLAELAHHFFEAAPAGVAGKAVDYARRAAERAAAQLAYEEAVRLYVAALRALDLAGIADEATRCELLLGLGEAQAAAGEVAAGKETFLQAVERARRSGSPKRLARAALGYGGRFAWARAGGDTRLVPLLEEALTGLPDEQSALRARLQTRLAGALRDQASPEPRTSLSREAVELARQVDDPATLAYALIGRRLVIWGPDNTDELLAINDEIVRLADDAGDTETATDARLLRLEAHLIRGDIQAVYADLEAAARLAEEVRRPSTHWHVAVHRVELALLQGHFAEAQELIAQTRLLGNQAWDEEAAVSCVSQTFALRQGTGGIGELEPDLERLVVQYPARPFLRCLLTVLSAELGREEQARSGLDSLAADDFALVPRDPEWMLVMALLADVAASLGDTRRAAVLYRSLAPYGNLVVIDPHEFSTGSAARSLGVLAATISRFDDAERHFRAALAMNERMGARPWVAHTEHDYARMLLARDAPGDREKARELLASAVCTYGELGMEAWVERASTLALELGVAATR